MCCRKDQQIRNSLTSRSESQHVCVIVVFNRDGIVAQVIYRNVRVRTPGALDE
jgi:hypothetical protein